MITCRIYRTVLCVSVVAILFSTTLFGGFNSSEIFLPSVAKVAGSGGSQFLTTVWVTNLGTSTVNFTFELLVAGQANPSPVSFSDSLAAGETRAYDDVIGNTFHLASFNGGARIVTADGELFVSERIYNQPSGTLLSATAGQFYSGIPKGFSIGSGDSASLQGVYLGSGLDFRYNYALLETSGQSCTVHLQAFDENGIQLGATDVSLQPYEQLLAPAGALASTASSTNARITATVTAGTGTVVLAGSQVGNSDPQDQSGFEMSFKDSLLGGGGGVAGVTSLNGVAGALTIAHGANTTVNVNGHTITIDAVSGSGTGLTAVSHDNSLSGSGTVASPLAIAGGQVVRSFNGLTDAVTLAAGSNITLTPAGNTVTIAGSGLTLPFSSTVSNVNPLFEAINSGAGSGVEGIAMGAGNGVTGSSGSGNGLSGGSGSGDGVRGQTATANFSGVEGINTVGSGVYGHTGSGDGVFGQSGSGIGVEGESTQADGVFGQSGASGFSGVEGNNTAGGAGVFGHSNSGTGVLGGTTSSSNSGVVGTNNGAGSGVTGNGTSGSGVSGNSTSGTGVLGNTSSGIGVVGLSSGDAGVEGFNNASGDGVLGHAQSSFGVFGSSSSGNGIGGETGSSINSGAEGTNDGSGPGVSGTSTSGNGVFGTSTSGNGVFGTVAGAGRAAIDGHFTATSGAGYGVFGSSDSSSAYGVYASGNMAATGTKSFVEPHPTDPTKEIRFVCLEGPESGTYFRGSAKIVNGFATIDVPESFRMVSSADGLTVVTTPMGAPAVLFCSKKGLDQIVIQANADVDFDYVVNGVRKAFADFQPIAENTDFVPRSSNTHDLIAGLPPESVLRLMASGILNEDGSINLDTAHRLGWDQQPGWNDTPESR